MLTVKHIDTNGAQTILEAARVRVVQGRGIGEDGIFLDPDDGNGMAVISGTRPKGTCSSQSAGTDNTCSRPFGEQPDWVPDTFKHVIHFASARASGDVEPMVYVMNRFGATVATYRL